MSWFLYTGFYCILNQINQYKLKFCCIRELFTVLECCPCSSYICLWTIWISVCICTDCLSANQMAELFPYLISNTIAFSDCSTLNFQSNYNLVYTQHIFKRYFFLFCVVQSSYFQDIKACNNRNEAAVFSALTGIKRVHEGLLSLMLNDLS